MLGIALDWDLLSFFYDGRLFAIRDAREDGDAVLGAEGLDLGGR